MRHIGLSVLFCIALAANVNGETIAVWNFNDAVSGATGGEQELLEYGAQWIVRNPQEVLELIDNWQEVPHLSGKISCNPDYNMYLNSNEINDHANGL